MPHTIELDESAFERLKDVKREGESWSELILRYVPRKVTVDEILQRFAENPLSDKTLDLIEESSARRRSIPREPTK